MLANRNLIGYYFLPEVYEKEVSKQEIKVLRMLLLDVFDRSALEGIDERSLSSVQRLEPILRSAEDLSRRYRLFVGENKMAAYVGDAAQ